MARIELDRVGLTFRVRHDKRTSLKELVLGSVLRRSRGPVVEVRALRDVCLEGRQGVYAYVRDLTSPDVH